MAVGGQRAHLRLLAILGSVVQLHREAGVVEEREGHGGALTPRLVRVRLKVRVRVRVANLVRVRVRFRVRVRVRACLTLTLTLP